MRSAHGLKPPIDIVRRVEKDFDGVTIGDEIDELEINNPSNVVDQDQDCTATDSGSNSADAAVSTEGTTAYQRTKQKYDDK